MNILEVEDIIKGLPDQALQKEAQAPSGQVPQFLVVSEIQRRTDMRKRFQSQQQQPQGTISQQIVQEGIASIAPPPQQMMPQQPMAPQQPMPPQQMPMGQPLAQPMYQGGIVEMQEGRQATIGLPDDEEDEERYGLSIAEAANNPMSIRQYDQDWEGETGTYSSKDSGDFVEYGSPEYSFRAADRILRTGKRKYGADTLQKALTRYAPPKGDAGYTNPTQQYIDYVSQQSGIDPNEPLDFEDPVTRSRLVAPMAFFESNTVITPSGVRDTIASVDEEYAATLPQRDVPFTPPRVESGVQVPTEGFPVPNVQTEDPRLNIPFVGVEEVGPENQYAGVENADALLSAIMEGKTLPKRTGGERRSSLSRLPVKDREAGEFTRAIANAIEEDAKRTKESDVQDKEQIEAVEAFTSGSTSLPITVNKERKKADLVGAGATRKEFMSAMTGPTRTAELVESIEKSTPIPKTPVDVGGLIDLIQPKEGSLDVGRVDLSPTPRVNQIEILKDDFRRKFNREMPRYLIKQALETGRYDNPNISPESEEVDIAGTSRKARRDKQKEIAAEARLLDQETQEDGEFVGKGRNRRRVQVEEKTDQSEGAEQEKDVGKDDESAGQQDGTKKRPIYDPLRESTVTQQDSVVDTPRTATTSGESVYDLMREIAGTKEEAKKEAFANAMIQLGAGVASGNLAAGLSAAGKAASETMGNYRDRALKGRLAEVQLKRADEQAAYRRRQEELSERREDRYSVTQANTALAKRLDEANFYITIPALLTEKLGRDPTEKEIRDEIARQTNRIIDSVATQYGVERGLLGGVTSDVEEEEEETNTLDVGSYTGTEI